MQAAGLLERRPHPEDRRLVRLCLTEHGRSLRQTIDDETAELTERALGALSDAERARFVRHLVQMREGLSG
jgi:DNA-binding MarR family transcriptional regulator